MMQVILGLAILLPIFIYLGRGEPQRLVRALESQGYSDIQLEHPSRYRCILRFERPYSYRARRPDGSDVHGGACVLLFFLVETTEPLR
jgi:hypothetical protein